MEGFEAGLDDMADDGTVKAKVAKKNNFTPAEQTGQKEFISLGSSARPQRDQEEEKEQVARVPGVKPTFRGKLNLTKTGAGADEATVGVAKTYDFGVVFKAPFVEGEERKHEPREPRPEGEPYKPR